jgi:DNA-binding response OmpR family regulator
MPSIGAEFSTGGMRLSTGIRAVGRSQTILIVEDDHKTAAALQAYFEHAGYRVWVAHEGSLALDLARQHNPDLLILDWLLPGMSGAEVCRILREESAVPIVMLTARTTEDDKLRGFKLGVDDYVTKPFSPREVVARARAVLRRTTHPEESRATLLRFSAVVLDRRRHEVSVSDRPVQLTPTEFRLLEVFLGAPGRVFTRDELVEQALGPDCDALDRTVDAHVKNLRGKLERGGEQPSIIRTVHGVGYKIADGTDED